MFNLNDNVPTRRNKLNAAVHKAVTDWTNGNRSDVANVIEALPPGRAAMFAAALLCELNPHDRAAVHAYLVARHL